LHWNLAGELDFHRGSKYNGNNANIVQDECPAP
jgi:hypothetical protein